MKFIMASLFVALSLNTALASEVFSCNGRALTVTALNAPNSFKINVANREITRYFAEQVNKTASKSASGLSFNADGSMTISNVKLSPSRNFVTFQFGPSLTVKGSSAKLVVTETYMTSSRSYETREIANWYFDSCQAK